MAQNLIRLKQIDQVELSGFIDDVLNTGVVNYTNITGNNVVYTTGNQTISGIKTFTTGINIADRILLDNNNIFLGQTGNIAKGTINLFGQVNINQLGINNAGYNLSYFQTGNSNEPFFRVRHDKLTIGTGANFTNSIIYPNPAMVYINGGDLRVDSNVFGSNLVYNTGDQTLLGNKNYLKIQDLSRILPERVFANSTYSEIDTQGVFGAAGTKYYVSGIYKFYKDNIYYKELSTDPFFIFFCDYDLCVPNQYAWVFYSAISGGAFKFASPSDSASDVNIFPLNSWTGSDSISFSYADEYPYYYQDYSGDNTFIKIRNDRTIKFIKDNDFEAASISKNTVQLEQASYGKDINLSSTSQIYFNSDSRAGYDTKIYYDNGNINVTNLKSKNNSYSYIYNTGNSTVDSYKINIFNNTGSISGFLDEVVDGKTLLIKNLSTGVNSQVVIYPIKNYNIISSGATGWGLNDVDQLSFTGEFLTGVKKISNGGNYVFILLNDQTLRSFGAGTYYQETQGLSLTGVLDVSCSQTHTLALLNQNNRTVTGWGANYFGEATGGRNLTGVSGISAGTNFSLAILSNGKVSGWGFNNHGQAVGSTIANNTVGFFTGSWNSTNAPISSLTGVKSISAGYRHSLAIFSGNNKVTGWGQNLYGQASGGNNLTGALKISAGNMHSIVVINQSGGRVTGWGFNTYGQAYSGNNLTGVLDISAGEFHNVAILQKDLRVTGWGYNNYNQTLSGSNLTGVGSISAALSNTAAIYFPQNAPVNLRGNEVIPNTATLLGSEKIENDTSLTIARKQSVELMGVKNSSYTGWISLNTNAGVI
jgi:alpha-tubulin suppressor-like RCC1 family protein